MLLLLLIDQCIFLTDPANNREAREGNTALCPKCGIDSVIGTGSGYPVTAEFLEQMYEKWFG
ncbi:hypothetical protein FRUB_06056 [Fimbriiglobus ruber]|uniref:Cytoplasmic protein n=1 Tax=Fimbriiglobus ruber TaxID=1908690 RepID=A0A225DES4_9BACT|nr:hypothetical protein FRUB_06056 [Fimbriiglobus ruber]